VTKGVAHARHDTEDPKARFERHSCVFNRRNPAGAGRRRLAG
jgi:hypothetical protein